MRLLGEARGGKRVVQHAIAGAAQQELAVGVGARGGRGVPAVKDCKLHCQRGQDGQVARVEGGHDKGHVGDAAGRVDAKPAHGRGRSLVGHGLGKAVDLNGLAVKGVAGVGGPAVHSVKVHWVELAVHPVALRAVQAVNARVLRLEVPQHVVKAAVLPARVECVCACRWQGRAACQRGKEGSPAATAVAGLPQRRRLACRTAVSRLPHWRPQAVSRLPHLHPRGRTHSMSTITCLMLGVALMRPTMPARARQVEGRIWQVRGPEKKKKKQTWRG